MKKILISAVILSLALSLSACAGSTSSSVTEGSSVNKEESTASQEQSSAAESKELTEEERYEEMVKRSLITTGETGRMARFFEKLEKGEETTVAFIGGSITEGMTVGAERCWAKRTYDYLCSQYPDTKINYVNAGMSGTPSILGNIRLRRDVLDKNPDAIFVEFAVNDGMEPNYKDSYDALVRTALAEPQNPAVILYFTVLKSGHTCEKHMSEVGSAYGLPMVSLNNSLKPEFESGNLKWEDYSDDESHPNEWGHKFTADLMINLFDNIKQAIKNSDNKINPLPEKWVFSDRFDKMALVDRTYNADKITISSLGDFNTDKDTLALFPNGWYIKGVPSETKPMEFTFKGSALELIYKCAANERYGAVTVTVDGKLCGTYNSYSTKGWNNPDTFIVYTGESGEHTVTLQLAGEKAEATYYFELLGLGIAE